MWDYFLYELTKFQWPLLQIGLAIFIYLYDIISLICIDIFDIFQSKYLRNQYNTDIYLFDKLTVTLML